MRIAVCYWKPDNPKEWEAGRFPTYYDDSNETSMVYGIPVCEYPGLFKVTQWRDLFVHFGDLCVGGGLAVRQISWHWDGRSVSEQLCGWLVGWRVMGWDG